MDKVVALAAQARAKHLFLFHHDPDHSDSFLDAVGSVVQKRIAESGSSIACELAREGALLTLGITA